MLYGDALGQSCTKREWARSFSLGCTKFGNCDFVFNFAERIEDSNLWFY